MTRVMKTVPLRARVRIASERDPDASVVRVSEIAWHPSRTAVIICDMWEAVDCISAARRAAEMAPHVNRVVARLRTQGATIVHAPSGCMDAYGNTAGRRLARAAPHAAPPVPVDWHCWDATREAPLAMVVDDSEPCSCDSTEPRCVDTPVHPQSRQIDSIEISEEDAITDDGQEVYNLLVHHAIDLVILLGVHVNRCVLGRPFGIRQLVYMGRRPVLCRDLTDSYHREPGGHFHGTDRVIAHIERYWCPTVTSDQLAGGTPFRFREDRRA